MFGLKKRNAGIAVLWVKEQISVDRSYLSADLVIGVTRTFAKAEPSTTKLANFGAVCLPSL